MKKSLQATILLFLFGLVIPQIVEITSISCVDDFIIKRIISIAFSLSTSLVGVLYAIGLLKGKIEGGKARINITLIIIFILLGIITSVVSFFKSIKNELIVGFSIIGGLIILLFVILLINKCMQIKNNYSAISKQVNNIANNSVNELKEKDNNDNNNTILQEPDVQLYDDCEQLKTIYELWNEKKENEKCITITNKENPNLDWIKIYKGPYSNGKFYGYIKMNNAHETINGIVYYPSKKIWYKI